MRWPLDYFTVTQGFSSEHQGVDLAQVSGTAIKSPEAGVVTDVYGSWQPGGYFGGNYVKVTGSSGYVYYMGHMSKTAVSKGDRVAEGQIIGYVGTTGQSTGPHVHFEMVKNGVKYDARQLIGVAAQSNQSSPKGGLMTPNFIIKAYKLIQDRTPSQEEIDFHMSKSNPESFINGFGDGQLNDIKGKLATTLDDVSKRDAEIVKLQKALDAKPKEVVVEKPVEVIKEVIKEVPVVQNPGTVVIPENPAVPDGASPEVKEAITSGSKVVARLTTQAAIVYVVVNGAAQLASQYIGLAIAPSVVGYVTIAGTLLLVAYNQAAYKLKKAGLDKKGLFAWFF